MEIKRLMYVTDAPGEFAGLEALLPLRELGLEEIRCIVPDRDGGLGKGLKDQGVMCEVFVAENLTVSGILNRASEWSVSLIAASLKREGGRVSNRSFARGLIRSSQVPVLMIPQKVGNDKPSGENIFNSLAFAIDRENIEENLLNFVMGLKGLIRELEIVNVIDKKLSIRDMIDIKTVLAETRSVFLEREIDAEVHIYAGKPAEEIMLAARDYGVKAIVMGKGHPSKLKHFFHRGCACRVAEKAPVPTLIVP